MIDERASAGSDSGRLSRWIARVRRIGVPGKGGPPLVWRLVGLSIGLVYLLIPGAVVQRGTDSAPAAVGEGITVGFAVLFLVTCAAGFGRTRAPLPVRASLLVTLTIVGFGVPITFGSAWIGLLLYLGVAYIFVLPSRWRLPGLAASTAAAVAIGLVGGGHDMWVAFMAFQTAAIGLLMLAFRNSKELVHQLREARGEVARLAANEERLRIARDMHDVLGHSLSMMALKSELAGELARRDGASDAAREIGDVESAARQALEEVRETVAGYRQRGLSEELDGARAMLDANGVEVNVRMAGTPLPDHLDGVLGWAVREGATNVVRHSNARHVTIAVERDEQEARVEIADDGTGVAAVPGRGGSGLAGLADRVAEAGGTVDVGPGPSGGFRLAVRLPAPIGEV